MSLSEGEDFIVITDKVWKYLYEIYSGHDIPRHSIEVETDNENSEKEYIVEVFHKKVVVYILPKRSFHLTLVRPAAVYMPR